jgi:hypothetical protein
VLPPKFGVRSPQLDVAPTCGFFGRCRAETARHHKAKLIAAGILFAERRLTQGIRIEMIMVQLPKFLAPYACEDKIRIGRDHDGGYIVSSADVFAAECLISLGLNDDWSFEEEFFQLNRCPVIGYDASVGTLVFMRRFVAAIRYRRKRRYHWAKLISYLQFFQYRNVHRRYFVAAQSGYRTVPFLDVVKRIDARRAFLKVDIEGAEYGMLDDITALSPRLTGLVIELHDCIRQIDTIRQFVDRIGLTLVHVHANNYGQFTKGGLPDVIELTFSASTPRGGASTGQALPHTLDQPNKGANPELAIRFGD